MSHLAKSGHFNFARKGHYYFALTILAGNVGRLVVSHQDRLLRFGAEPVLAI